MASLMGSLGLNVAAWNHGISQATRTAYGFSSALKGTTTQVGLFSSNLRTMLPLLTAAAFATALRWAAEFEQSMRAVMTMTMGTSASIGELSEKVRALSEKHGISAVEMAKATKRALSTNIPVEELTDFMDAASKLSVGSEVDLMDTVRVLAQLKNAFKLSKEDLAPLTDVLFESARLGAAEVQDLATNIGRVVPLARAAGLNIREMFAAVSATSLTMEPAQAMTAFRNALSDIIDPSGKAIKALKQIGIDFSPAAIKAKGFAGALREFLAAAKENPAALADIAEEIRSLTFFTSMSQGQLEDYIRIFDQLAEATGKAGAAHEEMLKGPMKKWEQVWAALKNQVIESGGKLLEFLMDATGLSGDMAAAQLRIAAAVKIVELACRIFFQIFHELIFGAIAGIKFFIQFWKNLFGWIKMIGGAAAWLGGQILAFLLVPLQALLDLLAASAEAVGFTDMAEGLRSAATSVNNLRNTMQDWGTDMMSEEWEKVTQEFDKYLDDVGDLRKDMGIEDHRKKIMALGQEIANMWQKARDIEDFPVAKPSQKTVAEAFSSRADDTDLDKERRLRSMQEFVKESIEELKRWHTDAGKVFNSNLAAWRKVLSESEQAYKQYTNALNDLDRDRADFNRDVNRKVFDLEQQDRSPRRQLAAVREMARMYEAMGNQAAQAGNMDQVKQNVQEAMGLWEEIASLEPTKRGRKFVVEQLKRLQDEMNQVYQREGDDLEAKRNLAQDIMDQAKANITVLVEQEHQLEQGFQALMRHWKDLGAQTMTSLEEMKAKIDAFKERQTIFIDANIDPALRKIEELKAALASLGFEGLALTFETPETSYGSSGPGRSAGQAPVNRAFPGGPKKMAVAGSPAHTSIDMGGITINYQGSGNSGTDARRLAREINRHIKRGQAAPLGGK